MLEVVNLEVNYGAIKALKNISFKVKSGQIVTLIGANGAGKSTTLRTISGLIKPKDGHIYFKGQEITNYEAHKIVELGISHVPEGRRIFETLTVMENLELAAWTIKDKKIRKEKFERIFDIFPRLKERRKQLAGTLSGGEQQMLSVARALTTGGELMLLDEPSMGLAPVLVDEIFQVLCQINLQGITILLVEQNARKALEIANYAYVLEAGTIALQGEAKELNEDSRVKEAYLGG
ncbi:MAG TPA: ABC transporter ATP-binding protein [Caldisericia bacterium]|jgi:branched-chain amino acid transport system ATP-binding protein|nr:ABC transporter ATP-binding protein [Caldisericia bacterium]HPB34565.1 ABC transporter ATP-binding protein [Caldisericia bacterium]HQL66498.1 ABC transporter ATP-binding protein [Caldisericia bacterium]HQN48076.1 ABC transporter ATP-binding protein [Caldisericia bacterium]HQO99868.1 ABC transporter ATP-binding protein [Caldisericia bacterium]